MSRLSLSTVLFLLIVAAGPVVAAHITDKLVVGLYAEADTAGDPRQLLSSGTPLEVVQRKGELVEVRLADDISGWVEARYVTEDKPAKVMLLEAQTRLRKLNKELQALKANGAVDAAAPAAAPAPPSARDAQLRQSLSVADKRIAELEQQLAERPVTEAAQRRLETLQGEVGRALEVLARAQGVELREAGTVADEGPFDRYRTWIVGLVAVLLGFALGVAFIDYRIRKRYGGFRI